MSSVNRALIAVVLSWLLAGCYAAERDAGNSNTNWLRCEKTSDCAEDHVCVARRCQHVASAQSAELVSLGAPTPLFELSDLSLVSGIEPAVSWVDDHWMVVSMSFGEQENVRVTELEIARITTDGNVERDVLPADLESGEPLQLIVAGDGRIGVPRMATPCKLDVYPPRARAEDLHVIDVPCDGPDRRVTAHPVRGSDDWVIAATASNGGAARFGTVSVGRHRMDLGLRTAQLTEVGVRQQWDSLGLFPSGLDLILVSGGRDATTIRTGAWIARNDYGWPNTSWSPPVVVPAGVDIDLSYMFAYLPERDLLFTRRGSAIDVQLIEPDGTIGGSKRIASAGTGQLSMARARELLVVGVCFGVIPPDHPTESEVWFVAIGEDGEPLGEPLVIAERSPIVAAPAGCSLAWSGTHFLALVWSIHGEDEQTAEPLTRMRGVLIEPGTAAAR